MGKAICLAFVGLLFVGFLRFLKIETSTATHGHVGENLDYPETRAAMLKTI